MITRFRSKYKKCKNEDEISNALRGDHIESDQHFKMDIVTNHIKYLGKQIQTSEIEIVKRASPL